MAHFDGGAGAGGGGVGDETQILDSDPPSPSPAVDLADGGETMRIDDHYDNTLPLDHEDISLCSEIEVLDDVAVMGEWGKTQVIDDFKEDGDGKTLVLSDAEEGDPGEEVSSAKKKIIVSDDEINVKSARRSFAAIRTSALRASGLAAARNNTPKADVNLVSSASLKSKGLSSSFGRQDNTHDIIMGTPKNDTDELVHADACAIEIEDFHISDNEERHVIKHSVKNPRVRKLFEEEVKSDCFLVSNSSAAGLSYIKSQEPGDLSQANALNIVDEFLSFNDDIFPQKPENGNSDIVRSPFTARAKGIHSLAKKVDRRNPVGKLGTYEWIDSIEDEGGGEFFTKIKDSFFGKKVGARKSRSLPSKNRLVASRVVGAASAKTERRKELMPKDRLKVGSVHSESNVGLFNMEVAEKLHASLTKSKKNLFKDEDEQLKEQHPVKGNHDGYVHNVGPDTQMAAEAMEALCCGTPCKPKEHIRPSGGENLENSSASLTTRNGVREAESTIDSEGIVVKSKQNMVRNKAAQYMVSSCRDGQSSLRRVKRSGNETSKSKVKKHYGNRKESSRCVNKRKVLTAGEKNYTRMVNYNPEPVSDDQLSDQIVEFCHLSSTPVAYRTRSAQSEKLLKKSRILSSEESVGKMHSSEPKKSKRRLPNAGSAEIEILGKNIKRNAQAQPTDDRGIMEVQCRSLIENICSNPKRRRTNISASNNQNADLSLSVGRPNNTNKPSVEQSMKDVPDGHTMKRRQTYVSRQMPNVCCSGTSSLLKSSTERDFEDREPNLYTVGDNDALNNCCTPVGKSLEGLHNDVADNHDKSPKKLCQSLSCETSLKEIPRESPICVAQSSKTSPRTGGLPRSRELIRLETCANGTPVAWKHLRRKKEMSSIRVLFSHHLDEDTIRQQKKILGRLGIATASSMLDATHFVADKFARTKNMLEAIACGKPVVTQMWLESCGQASCFLDEKRYILRDLKKEKEIGFSMPESLARACQRPLFKGQRVYITPNVQPDRGLIANLVKAAQGQPIKRMGRSVVKDDMIPDDLLIISCEEDHLICKPLVQKGAEVFSSELVLNGIVIQKLEFDRHRLFVDQVRATRSTRWLKHDDSSQLLPVTKCT